MICTCLPPRKGPPPRHSLGIRPSPSQRSGSYLCIPRTTNKLDKTISHPPNPNSKTLSTSNPNFFDLEHPHPAGMHLRAHSGTPGTLWGSLGIIWNRTLQGGFGTPMIVWAYFGVGLSRPEIYSQGLSGSSGVGTPVTLGNILAVSAPSCCGVYSRVGHSRVSGIV